MIIAMCTDDPEVYDVAIEAELNAPEIFGQAFDAFSEDIPMLAPDENLFIVAHGINFGDEGSPVIGSKKNDFYLTPRDLNTNLHVFPLGYRGNVYVSACWSADPGHDGESFVDQFYTTFQRSFPHSQVFGHLGKLGGALPPPGDNLWVHAAIVVN
jgi:hypothetical protein